MWEENKLLLPVAGIHYPKDWQFQCEGTNCRDCNGTRHDRQDDRFVVVL